MIIQKLTFASSDEPHQKVLFEFKENGVDVNYGTVFLKKGIRIPETGFTQHPQHEISYVQSGKIQILKPDGSNERLLKTGDVVSIKALEPQAGIVLEDTKIIYLLVG